MPRRSADQQSNSRVDHRSDHESDHGSDHNEVRLSGRLPAEPLERELPSGDLVWTFRIVVRRPDDVGRARVDTVDCAVYAAGPARSVRSWRADDVVEVEGALRRRFWRSPIGARSRYEVEVARARRLARATA
jgi:single-strand DNA-binding protein